MNHTVYADTLLLVNFSMDFLALYISARLMHMKIRPLRIATGATIGALFALAATVLEYYVPKKLFTHAIFVGTALCAPAMTACAFGGTVIGTAITYIAVNIGLGGIMTAVYSAINRHLPISSVSTSGNTASSVIFIVISLISAAVSLIYGKLRESTNERVRVWAEIGIFGKKCELTLLADSGNLLCDPFSGKPVVIVSADSVKDMLPTLSATIVTGGKCVPASKGSEIPSLRMIPTSAVTGSGILPGFVPDYILIDGHSLDVVVAVAHDGTDFGGCDGIIPQKILTI